jgi:LCP family protein required for cell wall assembly
MQRKTMIRAVVITVAAIVLLVGGLLLLEGRPSETRGKMSEGFGQLKTIEWNGTKYREKPAVTTLLIAGIDKPDQTEATGSREYRSGGQADFLLLLAIDHTDKTIHQLQIDRDTMTDVDVLGVFGNEVGTRVLQICLAHSFGKTREDNARYTVRAVQNLLGGLDLNGYYMIDYSAVPVLNDALGGVRVNVAFDMTPVNPAWTKGSTITLHGKEAESFVRARMTVGAGTNEERMVRQKEFMQSAIRQMNGKISADLSFGESLLKTLESIATTNLTTKRLAEELNKAYNYQIQDVEYLDGEYTHGEDGFMEFHMRENAAIEWVLSELYTRE